MNNITKSVTYFISNKNGYYTWEVSIHDNAPNEICLVYRDNISDKYHAFKDMTKAEAVAIARAILKLAGEE